MLAVQFAAPALGQSFNIPSGTTDTTPNTLLDGESGTIASGGALSIPSGNVAAITWGSGSIVVTNSGLISHAGTGRGFDSSGSAASRNLTFTNSVGATIQTSAQDAFRINTNITSGTVLIDNAGLIQAAGSGFAPLGQALDLRTINAASGVTVTVINRATGVIEALSDDALRPGRNATITNAGIIRSFGANTSGGADGTSDAIDAGARLGVVVTNQSGGLISGARHGITADNEITVTNEAGGTIIGRNGSGVGSDGNGTVTNYGTITGAYAGAGNIVNSSGVASVNGDGDGVDIDLIGSVTNYGIIEGTGAGGVDSGGNPNNSEGIAMGGGTIINGEGALISGATRRILIDDGNGNTAHGSVTIENAGTIQGLAGPAITVIGNFDDTLTNSGTINGSIDLGGGTNSLSNLGNGRLNAGALLSVGNGNTLTNAATISPGGNGTIQTTALTGLLNQTAAGNLAIDLNAAANIADRINVSQTAALAGSITLSVSGIAISSGNVTVLSAAGGATPAGLNLIASPALQAMLVYPNANDVQISYALSFAPTAIGLNANQTSLGNHLNAAVIAAPTSLSGVTTALLALTSGGAYTAALDQLSPEVYGDTAVSTLYGAHTFGNTLLSCHPREGAYVGVSEEECLWADVSGRDYEQDHTASGIGFDEQTWGVSGGAQVAVARNLVLGFAAGVERGTADTSTGASADTDRAYAGAALKHTSGPWLLAGAVFGGKGWVDTTRPINFGGLAMRAEGEQDLSHVTGRLRAAYQAGGNALYLKPMVDFEATQLWLGSVQETGGPAALSNASSDEAVFSAAPALEIGGETAFGGGVLLRPFARVGAIFYSNDEIAISSAFAGAPAGTPSFQTQAEIDRVMGSVGAGLDFIWTDSSTIKVHYDGLFGEDTQQHAFGAKASVNF